MATSVKEYQMIGAVARCHKGITGVISSIEMEKKANDEKCVVYLGVTLDGKAWQSSTPTILAQNINEYIEKFILHKESLESHNV